MSHQVTFQRPARVQAREKERAWGWVGLGKGKGTEAAKGTGKSKGQDALQRQQKAAATGATAEDALQAMLASLPDAGGLALPQLGSQISMKYPGGFTHAH